MPNVNEHLDVTAWTQAERQAVHDAIIAVGDVVVPGSDFTAMTDAELAAALTSVINEINVRPATVHAVMDSLAFAGTTIIREQP